MTRFVWGGQMFDQSRGRKEGHGDQIRGRKSWMKGTALLGTSSPAHKKITDLDVPVAYCTQHKAGLCL